MNKYKVYIPIIDENTKYEYEYCASEEEMIDLLFQAKVISFEVKDDGWEDEESEIKE